MPALSQKPSSRKAGEGGPAPSRDMFTVAAIWLPVVCLVVWVAAVVIVSALQPPNVEDVVRKMLLWGWIALWCVIFGLWYAHLRVHEHSSARGLYARLTLTPPSGSVVALAGGFAVRKAYLAFCFVIVGFATVLIWFADPEAQRGVLLAITLFTAVFGLSMAAWALRSSNRRAQKLVVPLGLALTRTPELMLLPSMASARMPVVMQGAQVFAGTRHGRLVRIAHLPDLAVTSVIAAQGETLWPTPPIAPETASRMAEMTGELASSFANVSVTTNTEGVRVERRGNGAGRHFLHDLLLAEIVADTGKPGTR